MRMRGARKPITLGRSSSRVVQILMERRRRRAAARRAQARGRLQRALPTSTICAGAASEKPDRLRAEPRPTSHSAATTKPQRLSSCSQGLCATAPSDEALAGRKPLAQCAKKQGKNGRRSHDRESRSPDARSDARPEITRREAQAENQGNRRSARPAKGPSRRRARRTEQMRKDREKLLPVRLARFERIGHYEHLDASLPLAFLIWRCLANRFFQPLQLLGRDLFVAQQR